MCLGIPGRVISVRGKLAIVDFWGTRKEVRLDAIAEPLAPGDYIINHTGFAVRRIPPTDVADTLALYEFLLAEAGEDPILADVVNELESAENVEFEVA